MGAAISVDAKTRPQETWKTTTEQRFPTACTRIIVTVKKMATHFGRVADFVDLAQGSRRSLVGVLVVRKTPRRTAAGHRVAPEWKDVVAGQANAHRHRMQVDA